jgi:hypothetical protein
MIVRVKQKDASPGSRDTQNCDTILDNVVEIIVQDPGQYSLRKREKSVTIKKKEV